MVILHNIRIIFTDIDGVLNDENDPDSSNELFDPQDIDPFFMGRLNRIIKETGAKVVISSSWRWTEFGYGLTTDELRAAFKSRGFEGEIVDVTPHLYRTPNGVLQDRPDEIQQWLNDCEYEIESFVILDNEDEDAFGKKFPNNFVHQVRSIGLQEDQMNKAIKILTES